MSHDFSQYEPVSKAKAQAAAALPSAPTPEAAAPADAKPAGRRRRKASPSAAPAPAPVNVKAPPPPPPVFVAGRPRSEVFPLDWPLAYEGQTFDSIVMRRPTEGEVGAFMDAFLEGASVQFPIFYTADDVPVPEPVIAALDPDDRDRILGRLSDFLPARLLRLAAALSDPSSILPPGATIAPTSST